MVLMVAIAAMLGWAAESHNRRIEIGTRKPEPNEGGSDAGRFILFGVSLPMPFLFRSSLFRQSEWPYPTGRATREE
jgi:hypothetical protein